MGFRMGSDHRGSSLTSRCMQGMMGRVDKADGKDHSFECDQHANLGADL